MPDRSASPCQHLVLVAGWVKARNPDAATQSVSAALKGQFIHGSATVVSYPQSTSALADFRSTLRQLRLEEAADFDG